MANLIDRDGLLDTLGMALECEDCIRHSKYRKGWCGMGSDWMYACEIICSAPLVDAVEVVRCKDCVLEQGCKVGQRLGADGYCSMGERREDG